MTSETVEHVLDAPVGRHRMPDRNFRLWLVFPAVLLLLLIGLFPLVYSLVISFQNLTMTDQDTSFHGLMNYAQLFRDHRLWQAILHTLLITAVALPLELVLGLMMAQLFLDNMPGRQLFIALIVLPTIISPIVAGATWRLLFDQRYGPVNQIISWLAGHQLVLLWTVNPRLVYPAIFICEIWQWTPFMSTAPCSKLPSSTGRAFGASSSRSCCRRSGRSWPSPSSFAASISSASST